jgi:CHAD domain-containing protein
LQAAAAPAFDWPAPAADDAGVAVRDPAFQVVLLEVQALAHAGEDRFTSLSARSVRKLVAARLHDLYRRVTRAAHTFERVPMAQQHRVRKQLKRLRYLAEFTLALWPEHEPRRTLRRLARAQEALGLHHDVAVAAAAFRHEAAHRPEAWFAAGFLQAHLAVTARAARQALADLGGRPAHWR